GIAPADLAGRSHGYGDAYRIYSSAAKVSLTAPARIGDCSFSHWDLLDNQTHRTEKTPTVDVALNSNTLVYCRYGTVAARGAALPRRFGGLSPRAIEREVGNASHAAAVIDLLATSMPAVPESDRVAGYSRVIRAAAAADAPVIGLIAEGEAADVLE